MIPRDAEQTIRSLLRGFPAITITGPRQSGKTTLAKSIFIDKPYVSLEDPDARQAALDDPRGFLERFPDGAVLDEVQRSPDILSFLQTKLDADGRMGLFILTGSQQFGLMSGISQSLAGRTAFLQLLPFSLDELTLVGKQPRTLDEMLFKGCYPPLYDRDVSVRSWYGAYVMAYIERDVRQLLKVQELEIFQRFVRFCAGRTGQLLNLSTLAADSGISHNTAKAWISVLEASYILFQLRPHHANFNKRLVKAPKLYFYDAGLVSWLLGIQTPQQLETHPLRGSIFETFVIAELMKFRLNRGEQPNLYFWRDSNGNEVDIIIEQGQHLIPIEIKSGKTVGRDFFSSLDKWKALAGDLSLEPTLIYGGTDNYRHKKVRVAGWNDVGVKLELLSLPCNGV